jgi:hypothetical protein
MASKEGRRAWLRLIPWALIVAALALYLAQRASVTVTHLEPPELQRGGNFQLGVLLTNNGRMKAPIKEGYVVICPLGKGRTPDVAQPHCPAAVGCNPESGVIPIPGFDLGANTSETFKRDNTCTHSGGGFTDEEFRQVRNGDVVVWMWGRVTYDDSFFGRLYPHTETFCWFYEPNLHILNRWQGVEPAGQTRTP